MIILFKHEITFLMWKNPKYSQSVIFFYEFYLSKGNPFHDL